MRAVAFFLALGCSKPATPVVDEPTTTPEPTPVGEPTPPSAADALADIETTLLERDLQLRFDIEASGAVQARLVGELRTKGVWVSLRATGSFAGQDVELLLEGDGERLTGSNGKARLDIGQPPELKDAIVIGLLRMGILHNLAVLVSARPPDHADGGVREWVQAKDVVAEARVTPEDLSPDAKELAPAAMSFAIVVDGTPSGEATLWWDRATKLPVERHVVVRFPSGDMLVRERYQAVE